MLWPFGYTEIEAHACTHDLSQPFPDLVRKKPRANLGLIRSRDEKWRLSRQTLSPTFSPFKMKAVSSHIITCQVCVSIIYLTHISSLADRPLSLMERGS